MRINGYHKIKMLLLILLFGLIAVGCVNDQYYVQLDDSVRTLQHRVDAMETKQAETSRKTAAELQKLTADTNVKLDSLETELQIIGANVEETRLGPRELQAVETKELQLLYDRIDNRLKKLETDIAALQQQAGTGPAAVSPSPAADSGTAAQPAPAPPEQPTSAREKAFYDDAYGVFKHGDFATARKKFQKFLTVFPESQFKVNAMFWIAECSYKQKQYEEAIIKYDEIITKNPRHQKVPSALLKQGFSFLMLGDQTDGKIILEKVIQDFPDTDQAEIAKRKLELLDN